MRWMSRRDRKIKKLLAKKDWHEWYAWYPVKLTNGESFSETVWLETVYRKLKWPDRHHRIYSDYDIAEMRSKRLFSCLWNRYEHGELTQIIIDSSNKQ